MRCRVVSALSRSGGRHICGFLRSVERVGANKVEVRDAEEREGLDGLRIGVVCADRIQKWLYQSSGEGRRCVAEGEKLERRRSCFRVLSNWLNRQTWPLCVSVCV